jgi:hypothetical protein
MWTYSHTRNKLPFYYKNEKPFRLCGKQSLPTHFSSSAPRKLSLDAAYDPPVSCLIFCPCFGGDSSLDAAVLIAGSSDKPLLKLR